MTPLKIYAILSTVAPEQDRHMARSYSKSTPDPTERIQGLLDAIDAYEQTLHAIHSMIAQHAPALLSHLPPLGTPELVHREREYQRIRGKYNAKNRDRMRLSRMRTDHNVYLSNSKGWREREDEAVKAVQETLLCNETMPKSDALTQSDSLDIGMAPAQPSATTRSLPSSRAIERSSPTIKPMINLSGIKAGPQRPLSIIAAEMNAADPFASVLKKTGKLLGADDVNVTHVRESLVQEEPSDEVKAEIQRLIDEGKL